MAALHSRGHDQRLKIPLALVLLVIMIKESGS